MVQNLAQAGRSHFCPTHLLYPPSRSYIPLFSWVEAKSVAVGLSTSEPNGGGRSILEWRDLKGLRGCGSFPRGSASRLGFIAPPHCALGKHRHPAKQNQPVPPALSQGRDRDRDYFTQLSSWVNTPYPTHRYPAYSASMKRWKFPKGHDPVSVAVAHLAAADFSQSGIDVAPQTGGVTGSTPFSHADQVPPPGPEEKQEREAEARLFGGHCTRNTNATGFTAFRNRSVQAGFDGYHRRITS